MDAVVHSQCTVLNLVVRQNAAALQYVLQNLYKNGRRVHKVEVLVHFQKFDKIVTIDHLKACMCTITISFKTDSTHAGSIRLCSISM